MTATVGEMMYIATAATILTGLIILHIRETFGKVKAVSHVIGQKICDLVHVLVISRMKTNHEIYRYGMGRFPDPRLSLIVIGYKMVNYFFSYGLTTSIH